MSDILKKTLKRLKGKSAARMFAAAMAAALLFTDGAFISFADDMPDNGQSETVSGQEESVQPENEQPENEQPVSGQPESEQPVSDQIENEQAVSAQPGEEMTDTVNAFLAAMDRLLELAGNDASAEEMLAAVEDARELYENLTDEEKGLPEVALRKEALDSFDSVMPLAEEETVDDEAALRAAVGTSAVANTTVVLGRDFTITETLKITTTNPITLDLNGHTLRMNPPETYDYNNYSVITVTNAITFTLKDRDPEQRGLITGGKSIFGGGVMFTSLDGIFIMKGGTISGNTANQQGGGVLCGTVIMDGGTISRNEARMYSATGGGVCCKYFIMTDGTISENEVGGAINRLTGGCGVYCVVSFKMSGGKIIGNKERDYWYMEGFGTTASAVGGGVLCMGDFEMTGGEISGNGAQGCGKAADPEAFNSSYCGGGGVFCKGNFTMSGGKISGNSHGGVSCWGNNFKMTGGIISGNRAYNPGADIYKQNGGSVLIRTSPDGTWGEIDGKYINGWYYDGYDNYNDPNNITETVKWSAQNVQKFTRMNEQFTVSASGYPHGLALRAAYDENAAPEPEPDPPTPPTPDPDPPTPPEPPHEHSYTQSKAPTCTADGEEKCSCGLTKAVPALGHSYDAGVITKEADCETAGVKTITCSRCNDAKTEELPALGHTYNNGTITTEAECEAPGVRTLTCSKCNRTKTEAIPAIGHRWDNGEVTKEPTYEEEGVKTYTCLNDETHKKTEPIEKLKDNGGQTNPSNTDNGDKEKKQEEKKTETPEPVITHTPEPIPDAGYEYPAYRNETPDANDPETPEIIVVIGENGTPLTYRKVEDPEHPGKMIYVEDSSIPLSASPITEKGGHWALLNLIMTLVSVLGGVYGLIGYVTERRKKDKEEKRRRWHLVGAVMALLSVIVFVLTQDMRMMMVFADKYTFLMIALALMQTPGFLLRRKEEELA